MMMFKYRSIKEGDDLDYEEALDIYKLQFFRDKMQFYWYQLIGLIDVDMFHFLIGAHVTAGKQRNATAGFINGASIDSNTNNPDAYNYQFSPCGIVTWSVEKDEDENYYLNPTPTDYTFEPMEYTDGYSFFGSPGCIYDWSNESEIATSSAFNYYYSKHELNLTRTDYMAMRSSDPYKKLKHVIYDVHNLDVINIRNIMSQTYLGQAVAKDTAIISTSAVVEPISQRKDGTDDKTHNNGEIAISAIPDEVDDDSSEKGDDDTNKISAIPEIPVSVTAEEVDKMKKQLKLKEEQLKKQKDKEAKADKQKKEKSNKK